MGATERIKIRGLLRGPGWAFLVWGTVVLLKGLYDLLWGQPEANHYSPQPWQFITREAWLRYAGFEAVYGLACLGLARLAFLYARELPETVERPLRRAEPLL